SSSSARETAPGNRGDALCEHPDGEDPPGECDAQARYPYDGRADPLRHQKRSLLVLTRLVVPRVRGRRSDPAFSATTRSWRGARRGSWRGDSSRSSWPTMTATRGGRVWSARG